MQIYLLLVKLFISIFTEASVQCTRTYFSKFKTSRLKLIFYNQLHIYCKTKAEAKYRLTLFILTWLKHVSKSEFCRLLLIRLFLLRFTKFPIYSVAFLFIFFPIFHLLATGLVKRSETLHFRLILAPELII